MSNVNDIISLSGRTELFTSYDEITDIETLLPDFQLNLAAHYANVIEIEYLKNYWKGAQTILDRVKVVREDIDNKVVINLAQSSTRMITGYTFGKPIEFIHKKENDEDEIEILNNCFSVEHKTLIDNEIFTDMSVNGIGYRLVTPQKGYSKGQYELGVSPFSLTRLDPKNTFVVYSTDIPKRAIYACHYHNVKIWDSTTNSYGEFRIFTIYQGNREYRFKVGGGAPSILSIDDMVTDPKINLLGIPIIEYRNNMSISGDWELAISIMDALNVVASDSVNDVVQFVQSILVFINADLDDPEVVDELKKSKMLSLISTQGLNADVKYISDQLDSAGVHTLREWLEEEFDIVVGIPDRKTRGGGGGDTGEAVKLRDGWGDLEVLARSKEPYVRKGEMETLKFAINSLKVYNLVEDLKIYNIEIKFSRNKNDNLLVKTQSYSNLIGTKTIAPEDAVNICDFTNDSKEIASKGESYWAEKAEAEVQAEEKKLSMVNEVNQNNEAGQDVEL